VSISAARKLGIISTLILSLAASHAIAGNIYITAKGTVRGEDYLHFFIAGFLWPETIIPKGTPFQLIFTFDDAKGEPITTRCANSGSGVTGVGEHSPGTASIMIDDASYAFGRKDNAQSRIWKGVPSSCGNGGGIVIDVSEGRKPAMSTISLRIHPAQGSARLTQDADWRSPVSLSRFSAPEDENTFVITRPGNYGLMTRGFLKVESVIVGVPDDLVPIPGK
jgi:hypothetical protein